MWRKIQRRNPNMMLGALHAQALTTNRMDLDFRADPQHHAASPSLDWHRIPPCGAFAHADFVDQGENLPHKPLFAARKQLIARTPSDVTQFTRHHYAAKRGTHAAMGSTTGFCGGFGQILAPSRG